ncbi:hypothetical protein ElyMa_001066200 [Elysia marginata]|uniref:Uncharacterized protein n=1 Tax=Elysia marginata TaxID=1093978 RepID=A0AAV4HPZ4_9GAST|nr:hypothetical protein ElyMa_001066200 [Elysia marginata]
MGTLIALSGLMLFFLPPIQRWHQRRSTADGLKHDADLGRHILPPGKHSDKEGDIGLVQCISNLFCNLVDLKIREVVHLKGMPN